MSFARLVLSTSSVIDMPKIVRNVLPQRYEVTPLVEHYLENIHVLYPFLLESKIFQSIDAVYQENGRHALPIDHWTIRLVLATANASLSRERGDSKYQDAVRHAVAALEEIETVVHPGSIVGIQSILQLVLYATLDPCHFNSWYLVGVASRVMVDLGLHQLPPEELRLKHSEPDMRSRVYDSVYALDRSVTLLPYPYSVANNLCLHLDLEYLDRITIDATSLHMSLSAVSSDLHHITCCYFPLIAKSCPNTSLSSEYLAVSARLQSYR